MIRTSRRCRPTAGKRPAHPHGNSTEQSNARSLRIRKRSQLVPVDLDLPIGVYLRARQAAKRIGFRSLQAWALHVVQELTEDAQPPAYI